MSGETELATRPSNSPTDWMRTMRERRHREEMRGEQVSTTGSVWRMTDKWRNRTGHEAEQLTSCIPEENETRRGR